MGRNFKFQVQDSDLEYFWGEIALSEKKPPSSKVSVGFFFSFGNLGANSRYTSYI